MNIEEVFDYCQSIQGAEATTPFDEVTIVMKVHQSQMRSGKSHCVARKVCVRGGSLSYEQNLLEYNLFERGYAR